jgi:WD40 repeat protein
MRINSLAAMTGAAIMLGLLPAVAIATTVAAFPRPVHILSRTAEFLTLNRWNSAALVRLSDGKLLREFPVKEHINNLAVSLDERYVLATCSDGTIQIWEIQSGASVCSTQTSTNRSYPYDASFAGDGRSFIVVAHQVLVYETVSGRLVREMSFGQETFGLSAALSPDGSKGVVMAHNERLYTFDLAQGNLKSTNVRGHGPVRYSRPGDFVVLRGLDRTPAGPLLLVRMDGSLNVEPVGSFSSIGHVDSALDGGLLVTSVSPFVQGAKWTTGWVIDAQLMHAKEVWSLEGNFHSMTFNPNLMIGVVGDFGRDTKAYDLRNGDLLYTVGYVPPPITTAPAWPMSATTPTAEDSPWKLLVIILIALLITVGLYLTWRLTWIRNSRITSRSSPW